MSKIKDLELENAILKAQIERARARYWPLESACHQTGVLLHNRGGSTNLKVRDLLWHIADDLGSVDLEFDRYYIEKE